MSKYRNLSEHLAGLTSPRWNANFAEIEAVLGFKLPKSAYTYPAWWANQTGGGHSHCAAWKNIGWRTENVDILREQVSFVSVGEQNRGEMATPSAQHSIECLTIGQAKAGLAANFGVQVDNIEITIRY